jgi:tetratricopeptide (TPR) repeat protein
MKKTTFVALLLLTSQCFADNLQATLQTIESEWISVYYKMARQKQIAAFPELLNKADKLSSQYPNKAEPLFWQAVIKATYADYQDAISALKSIHEARDLLIKAIKINPQTMNGSAYVTLGTLYYMVPKWPIAFGDNAKAKEMLETALKINPNGIDTNFYYGDFLLSNNEIAEAENYFLKAVEASASPNQSYTDIRLKEEAKLALKKTKAQKISDARRLLSFFNVTNVNK